MMAVPECPEMSAVFSDGVFHPLELVEAEESGEQLSLQRHGLAFVRGSTLLRSWVELHWRPGQVLDEEARQELAEIVARLAREAEGGAIPVDTHWEVGNIILRRAAPGSYTRTAHRDLDEQATANLRSHQRLHRFYNAWVPLSPVLSDPLALLLPPASGAEPHQPASFLGYSTADRTGLLHAAGQRWVYLAGMRPGDAILWHSDRVFHASFALPNQPSAARESVDIRVYFAEPHSSSSSSSS